MVIELDQQHDTAELNKDRLKPNSRIYRVKITEEERKRLIEEAKEKEFYWGKGIAGTNKGKNQGKINNSN